MGMMQNKSNMLYNIFHFSLSLSLIRFFPAARGMLISLLGQLWFIPENITHWISELAVPIMISIFHFASNVSLFATLFD